MITAPATADAAPEYPPRENVREQAEVPCPLLRTPSGKFSNRGRPPSCSSGHRPEEPSGMTRITILPRREYLNGKDNHCAHVIATGFGRRIDSDDHSSNRRPGLVRPERSIFTISERK